MTISPKQYEPTAVLLAPRLWGCGRVLATHVEITLESYRALGWFSFGVVPEEAFHHHPQNSRLLAHTFDGFGRLHVPGGTKGNQVKRLYGQRVSEGDSLGLLVRPVEGQAAQVECSFLVNSRNLGPAFVLDADRIYRPVLYFHAMCDTSGMKISLPQHPNVSKSRADVVPKGLVFSQYGNPSVRCLETPIDTKTFEYLTVADMKEKLAELLNATQPAAVSHHHVDILIDGKFAHQSRQLRELVYFRDGLHIEDLCWHIGGA
jgi:hypothetical protein